MYMLTRKSAEWYLNNVLLIYKLLNIINIELTVW